MEPSPRGPPWWGQWLSRAPKRPSQWVSAIVRGPATAVRTLPSASSPGLGHLVPGGVGGHLEGRRGGPVSASDCPSTWPVIDATIRLRRARSSTNLERGLNPSDGRPRSVTYPILRRSARGIALSDAFDLHVQCDNPDSLWLVAALTGTVDIHRHGSSSAVSGCPQTARGRHRLIRAWTRCTERSWTRILSSRG